MRSVVYKYFDKTKGEGARKLVSNVKSIPTGLGEKKIQKSINKVKNKEKLCPLFQNRAPLKPITAEWPQYRLQIDLVEMKKNPVTANGIEYKYVLSVLDICNRYLLEDKESATVAAELVRIFSIFGPPVILQSDQGPEFKGTVALVCSQLEAESRTVLHILLRHKVRTNGHTELGRKNCDTTLYVFQKTRD